MPFTPELLVCLGMANLDLLLLNVCPLLFTVKNEVVERIRSPSRRHSKASEDLRCRHCRALAWDVFGRILGLQDCTVLDEVQ